jgi:hypothetical protein
MLVVGEADHEHQKHNIPLHAMPRAAIKRARML